VMVFYIARGATGTLRSPLHDLDVVVSSPRRQIDAPKIDPTGPMPLPLIPLPPLAEPARVYSREQIEYLGFLHSGYRRMVASMVVPGMDQIFTPDAQLLYPNPSFGKAHYTKIAQDFVGICNQAARTFTKPSGGGDSGSTPVSLGGST